MEWLVEKPETLGDFLRARAEGRSWNQLKRIVASGKVFVDGRRALSPTRPLVPGQRVELKMAAPRPREGRPEVRLVFEDAHLVVIDKPSGVSSVPFEKQETGTAMDLVRDAWRRLGRPATSQALFVVHRIDKDTSGLLVYAKSKRAERALAAQFRAHTVGRTYLCVAHGAVASRRLESRLVADRGDGLRGSTNRRGQGKTAITHLTAVRPLAGATLCEVRLETGKTHQIRIHLAEAGHMLVGETVYLRDHRGPTIASPRLLLHAASLALDHPLTGRRLAFESDLPADFRAELEQLT
jgi:23S rRNA pseudouridine1911/1915/1917 synthase